MEMVFDINAQELFQIIGELYVEKRKATEACLDRDKHIAELTIKLEAQSEDTHGNS